MADLTVAKVAGWLNDRLSVDVADWNPNLGAPDAPDRIVLLTPAGGPGLRLDGAVDEQTYNVRSRGLQRDPEDAQQIAAEVDRLIDGTEGPITVGDVRVVALWRVGSPPAMLAVDSAGRTHYSATYLFSACR